MTGSFHCRPRGRSHRIAFVLLLSVLGSDLGRAAEGALTGNWFTETEVSTNANKSEKRGIVWKFSGPRELTMGIASIESGTLTSNPERWAVRRPDHSGDLAHGTFRLTGPDSFSTRIAGLPAADILWKRLPRDGRPTRVPSCLMKLIVPGPAANAARPEFNPALVGIWEATYTLNGLRRETVWRITPAGQSLRIDVEMRPMTYTASGGRLRIVAPDGGDAEFTYRITGKDTLETTSGNERSQWSRCKE